MARAAAAPPASVFMVMFLFETPENASLNQYWYSEATLTALVCELESGVCGKRIAFLSTPSVYFSLTKDSDIRRESFLFDLDEQWSTSVANFRKFDFNDGAIESSMRHSFDCCVIDPPFITKDVWQRYAMAARTALVRKGGKLILTTVAENEAMLCSVFGTDLAANLRRTEFMPAMHRSVLPYQYSLFVNYKLASNSILNSWNTEIPDDFKFLNNRKM
mmetsp:Transcript_23818/g.31000  ORF Transcript_23818/g.31000 Transcript_23818/m.31000 type:complete len:218 (-) Transcript_23818:486-1139(-)